MPLTYFKCADTLLAYCNKSIPANQKNRPFGLYKGGEKLAESEEDLLEHRTDGTDAFDTLYIGCEKFPFRDSFSLSMSGVL